MEGRPEGARLQKALPRPHPWLFQALQRPPRAAQALLSPGRSSQALPGSPRPFKALPYNSADRDKRPAGVGPGDLLILPPPHTPHSTPAHATLAGR
eukprot:364335-Chlamydomonas_euryale.AAC.5